MESMYIKNPRYIKDNHCIGSIFITGVMNALAEGNKKCVLLILQEIKKLGMTCRAVRKKNKHYSFPLLIEELILIVL